MTRIYQDLYKKILNYLGHHGNLCSISNVSMNSPKLVILHGWGGSKLSWKLFVKKANEFFDTEVIELPCFGDEPCPQEVWGVEEYADFVKVKVKSIKGKEKIILLGHSFGGQIATYLAANNSELIDKLILSGAAVYRPKKSIKRLIFGMLAKSGKILTSLPGLKRFQPLAKKVLYKTAQSPDYGKTDGIKKEIYKKVIRQDVSHLLPNIQTPTLVIWGDRDSYVPLTYGRKITKELPNAQLEIIKGGTHGLHIKETKKMINIIKKFIES